MAELIFITMGIPWDPSLPHSRAHRYFDVAVMKLVRRLPMIVSCYRCRRASADFRVFVTATTSSPTRTRSRCTSTARSAIRRCRTTTWRRRAPAATSSHASRSTSRPSRTRPTPCWPSCAVSTPTWPSRRTVSSAATSPTISTASCCPSCTTSASWRTPSRSSTFRHSWRRFGDTWRPPMRRQRSATAVRRTRRSSSTGRANRSARRWARVPRHTTRPTRSRGTRSTCRLVSWLGQWAISNISLLKTKPARMDAWTSGNACFSFGLVFLLPAKDLSNFTHFGSRRFTP